MLQRWEKNPPKTEARIVDHSEENVRNFDTLMNLWAIAFCADGIRAFVIGTLKISMLWGLSGCERWAEFCERVLRISPRTADRMCAEGAVCRRLLGMQTHFETLMLSANYRQFGENVRSLLVSMDSENARTILPALEVVKSRKLLRTIREAPMDKWQAVVAHAQENSRGAITVDAIRGSIEAVVKPADYDSPFASDAPIKSKPDVDEVEKPLVRTNRNRLDLDEWNRIRDLLYEIGGRLQELSQCEPGTLRASAAQIRGYCHQLRSIERRLA